MRDPLLVSPPVDSAVGRPRGPLLLAVLCALALAALALPGGSNPEPVGAQACPPYCDTPVITPAWHVHMCDEPYQEQLDDNHCMYGPGVTEFPAGTDRVYVIYCHQRDDTVRISIRDTGGGLQYVNHPDGLTYAGSACETMAYSERNGIAPGGSPYFTTMYWPEGPFSGVGAGIEWYVGLFIAWDADFYYGEEALARITARDPAANLDPLRRDRITMRVSSDSDPEGFLVELEEEAPSLPIFKSVTPIGFSREQTDAAAHELLVASHDEIYVSYCPRDCQTAYEDRAVWLATDATVTPTSLPTYAGPPPTATATPPPELQVRYTTLRPAPADVGYAPQKSANKSRVNHLGYPTMYVGMWTRGDNLHFGMVQFDLETIPGDATIIDARLELDGQSDDFTDAGRWRVQLLGEAVDAGWREASFEDMRGAPVIGRIGAELTEADLRPGRTNSFGFAVEQLAWLDARLRGSRRASFRVDGPDGEDNNLFAWHTGVDVYGRASEPPDPALGPRLVVGYTRALPSATPGGPPSATLPPPATATARPSATASPSPPPSTPTGAATAIASATPVSGASPSPTVTQADFPTPTGAVGSTETPDAPTTATASPGASSTAAATAGSATAAAPTATPQPTLPGTPAPDATSTRTAMPTAGSSSTQTPPPVGATATPPPGGREGRQICVVAFRDANGNTVRDPEERFLAGVTVRLRHEDSGAFVTWTTDGANDPDFCWAGLADGRYTLRLLELPRDHVASGPAEFQVDVPLAAGSVTYAFGARPADVPTATPSLVPTEPPPADTLTPEASPTPRDTPTPTAQPTVVGPQGEICASAWEDRDGNGFLDADETWVADLLVEIARSPDGQAVRALRTLSGRPVCSVLPSGVWHVRLVDPAPWNGVGEASQAVLLTEGSLASVSFPLAPLEAGRAYLPFAMRRVATSR